MNIITFAADIKELLRLAINQCLRITYNKITSRKKVAFFSIIKCCCRKALCKKKDHSSLTIIHQQTEILSINVYQQMWFSN